MRTHRSLILLVLITLASRSAAAQTETEPAETEPAETTEEGAPAPAAEAEVEEPEQEGPKQGDFDAGFQVRMPNGPDEMGEYGSFNWVAVDLQGKYLVTNSISAHLDMPLAIIKPDIPGTSMFGGVTARGEAALGSTLGAQLTLGFMRERAFLLSQKDFPLYTGDLAFGATAGPFLKLKLLGLDVRFTPSFVYQDGDETLTALQIPTSAVLKLGEYLEVSAESGLYTGDDFKLGPKDGGRIYLGAAVTAKIGFIIVHLGGGAASLLVSDAPGALYPSVSDSIYFDFNIKYGG